MPLDNTAKLADIISLLQTLEGINQKADLAAVIGAPSVTSDAMAMLIQAIQTDKINMASRLTSYGISAAGTETLDSLVGKIPTAAGKKWASGTVISTGTTASFVNKFGTTVNTYFINVTGLTFKPKTIEVYLIGGSPQFSYYEIVQISGYYVGHVVSIQGAGSGEDIRKTGNFVITTSEFQAPVSPANAECFWIATE